MYEAPGIIGTCINCISQGSLSATLAIILAGIAIALIADVGKLVEGHSGEHRSKIKSREVPGRSLDFEEVLFAQKRETP